MSPNLAAPVSPPAGGSSLGLVTQSSPQSPQMMPLVAVDPPKIASEREMISDLEKQLPNLPMLYLYDQSKTGRATKPNNSMYYNFFLVIMIHKLALRRQINPRQGRKLYFCSFQRSQDTLISS